VELDHKARLDSLGMEVLRAVRDLQAAQGKPGLQELMAHQVQLARKALREYKAARARLVQQASVLQEHREHREHLGPLD
jgi:hypothetical protein